MQFRVIFVHEILKFGMEIDKLLQFSLDCPHDCDFYTNNNNQEQLCNTYWNSLKDLYNWSLYQCGQ